MRPASLRTLAAAALFACASCYTTKAPKFWLSDPLQAQREAWGGWIIAERMLQPGQKAGPPDVHGELIATSADSLHVLTDTGLVSLSPAGLKSVRIWTYGSNWEKISGWATVGSLSTMSHGIYLLLSLPAWIITGAVATVQAGNGPMIDTFDPTRFRPYARFPQGIPSGLDRSTLRIKKR